MPARAQRKRTWGSRGQVKTADNMTCLRGAATGGAEKYKDLELPEKDL